MGQKVNPKIYRIGTVRSWSSKWFSKRDFSELLKQDVLIKKFVKAQLKEAGVARIEIGRSQEKVDISIYAMKPGVIIGRSGAGIEDLKKKIEKTILNKEASRVPGKVKLNINIHEITQPNLNAQVVVDGIINDLERRMPYRRILKQVLQRVERAGAKGVKVQVGGRLNGAEIARSEHLTWGRLPLHTLRADIDYARGAAHTIYGKIGVKVWIYRGDVFNKDTANVDSVAKQDGPANNRKKA